MIRLLISAVMHLAANAIGLLVAAAVLDDMSLDAVGFVIAVLIFTVVAVVAQPLLQKIALQNVHALAGSVALVTTFVGLVVTDVFSDGLEISGLTTWVLATIIVWLAALVATLILPLIFLRKVAEEVRDDSDRGRHTWGPSRRRSKRRDHSESDAPR